jgi:transposase InsO family protein
VGDLEAPDLGNEDGVMPGERITRQADHASVRRARDARLCHWHNTERLHGYLNDVPPAEFEAAHYAALVTTNQTVGIQ